MPKLSWITCPHCNFPNIPEEQYCKRCHGNLWVSSRTLPTAPATGDTVTFYPDNTGKRLLTFSCRWLEYEAPDIAFRTPWQNLTTIHRAWRDYYLYMLQEPDILHADWTHMPRPTLNVPTTPMFPERRISLNGFGFPENKSLCADLCRYAPYLCKYIPK
jgi:hypothetical protein